MNNNYKVAISRIDLYSKKYENVSTNNKEAVKNISIKGGLIEVLINMISK
ncbi:hypothetical protein [Terrisporobacter muris]|uniref:Uncharacterized protein n=1 Tax=Terrisporobacter muris TaxID=2963284 RepID=A0A9X2MD27_9FIRM|nr:hypothetical protein [Terrisporobacter muris]MCR1823928.1 hypothetical protein [Terrisporobacter muris]